MPAIPSKCPTCQQQMVISQLTCPHCNTAVAGYYPISAFANLPDESLKFLESFIRNRGNVKDMERESGQSYWTIRTQLDKVIQEMGLQFIPTAESLSVQRKQILEKLGNGEISVDEATRSLTELGKK